MSGVVLAIDTATPAVTAGIVSDGKLLAERVSVDARAHAERLTPNVLGALADADLQDHLINVSGDQHNLALNGIISGAGGLSVNVPGNTVTIGGTSPNTSPD